MRAPTQFDATVTINDSCRVLGPANRSLTQASLMPSEKEPGVHHVAAAAATRDGYQQDLGKRTCRFQNSIKEQAVFQGCIGPLASHRGHSMGCVAQKQHPRSCQFGTPHPVQRDHT